MPRRGRSLKNRFRKAPTTTLIEAPAITIDVDFVERAQRSWHRQKHSAGAEVQKAH